MLQLKVKSKVFISKLKKDPKENIAYLLDCVGLPQDLTSICIKPNLNDYRKWETAATSDPYVLDAFLSVLRDRYPGASISLVENNSTSVNTANIFSYLGIDIVAERHNVSCINAASQDWKSVEIDGLHFKKMEVPEILNKSYFITFPKLKSHSITKLTCGLKNQMGLFRPKRKIVYHHIVDDLIVDCNLAMKPSLSLVDANLVMEGNYGPTYGSPKKLGLLIASGDIVAGDSFCANFFGFNARSVKHIKRASERGLGETNYNLEADFDFDINEYKLRFSLLLYHIIRKGAAGLKR